MTALRNPIMSDVSNITMNDLIQIYKQVEKHCLCLDNSSIAIISQSLEIGLKDSISTDEELHVLLLSINILHLMIKKINRAKYI